MIYFSKRNEFSTIGIVEQFAHRGCGVSILGYFQDLTR